MTDPGWEFNQGTVDVEGYCNTTTNFTKLITSNFKLLHFLKKKKVLLREIP